LRSAAFSAGDGKYVVVATDSSMLVLDASDGHTVDQQALATSGADPSAAGAVGGIAASSDARTIVMERGKELASWNRVDKRVTELSDGSQITTIAVSADGMRVAAGVTEGDRHEIWVWADGKAEPQKLASRSVVTAVDLSSEGQLYAGTLEGTVTSWDLLTDDSAGQQLSYDLDGAVVDLETAGEQTDGTLLETVATNRTVAVYDLYNSYHERQDPTKALRQIHLYPTEGDVLRARLDGDQLHVAESDGFTYTLENVGHHVDVGTTLEEAERLRDQSGLRLTTAECADADLPCPKD
jgi:WD40 repeat protein